MEKEDVMIRFQNKRTYNTAGIKKYIRKITAAALSAAMVMMLGACGSDFEGKVDDDIDYSKVNAAAGSADSNGHKIGVSMPTKDLQRWVQDGENMQAALKDSGFVVDLQYADNETSVQAAQIQEMIDGECEILVVAAIDGTVLTDVLANAKEAGIQVISYDRLIIGSDAVSYYATFDNQLVGTLQGQYIVDALDLDNAEGTFNIELFTGSPDDNNCNFFFGGAMEVLQPYIDSGKLVVKSGQTEKEECSTQGWSTDKAKARMDKLLDKYYTGGTKLDAVLSSNDSVANGITASLLENYKGDFPVLTGQDCDINSVKNIIKGRQSMSIFKDTRELAAKVVEMVRAIVNDEEVPVNDTESYDNGTGIIPSYLCEPVFADINNYEELLIESGYYTTDQLK